MKRRWEKKQRSGDSRGVVFKLLSAGEDCQLVVNWWFGLVVWIPGIPL